VKDRFIVQPGDFCHPSELRPATMSDLLADLGVTDQPEEVRAAAIRKWLETNEPMQLLELYLVDEGFLDHVSDWA
jgi:hypothetical protein